METIYWNTGRNIVPVSVDEEIVLEIVERHRNRESGIMNMIIGEKPYAIDADDLAVIH